MHGRLYDSDPSLPPNYVWVARTVQHEFEVIAVSRRDREQNDAAVEVFHDLHAFSDPRGPILSTALLTAVHVASTSHSMA
jgi:hypothetical protein